MPTWFDVVSLIGALGLFVAGQRFVERGSSGWSDAVRQRFGRWFRGRSGAFGSGLAVAALMPSTRLGTQMCSSHTAAETDASRRLDQTLTRLTGGSFAAAISAWCAVLALSTPIDVAWIGMALGGLALAVSSATRWSLDQPRALGRTAASGHLGFGLGLAVLALCALRDGLEPLEGLRLDAWNVGLPVRFVVWLGIGALGSAVTGSLGGVVVGITLAAEFGFVAPTSAIATVSGAGIGALTTFRATWKRGSTRALRGAIGYASLQGLALVVTVLAVALTLPVLDELPAPLDRPAVLTAAFVTATTSINALLCAILTPVAARLLTDRLTSRDTSGHYPSVLDPAALCAPGSASASLEGEVEQLRAISSALSRRLLGEERVTDFRLARDIENVAARAEAITAFSDELLIAGAAPKALEPARRMPSVARALHRVCSSLVHLREDPYASGHIDDSALRARVMQLRWSFLGLIERAVASDCPRTLRAREFEEFAERRRDVEQRLLEACARQSIDLARAHAALDSIGVLRDLATVLAEALPAGYEDPEAGSEQASEPRGDTPEVQAASAEELTQNASTEPPRKRQAVLEPG